MEIANAVEMALDILEKGCWTEEWNQDVKEGDRYFAKVDNPDKYTGNWRRAYSGHSTGAKESPPLARVRLIATNRTEKAAAAVINFDYVLKYYPNEGMAITANTDSFRHSAAAPGYYTGLDKNVNVRFAREFINLARKRKCK